MVEATARSRRFFLETALLGTVCLFLSGYLFLVMDGLVETGIRHKPFSLSDFLVIVGCVACITLLLYRLCGIRAIYGLLSAGGLFFAIGQAYFVPDEGQHFAYIEHIATKHRLPTVRDFVPNTVYAMEEHIYPKPSSRDPSKFDPSRLALGAFIYEAMHPPLYYLAASAVYLITPGDLIAKLYVLRVVGVLTLIGFAWVMVRSYRKNTESGVIPADDFLFFGVLCLFTLTPGILLSSAIIRNLALTLVLCGLFYHRLACLQTLSRQLKSSDAAILGVITGCAIATHFFNATLLAVGTMFLLLRRSHRLVPAYLLCAVAVPAPWFVFNWLQYGSLTGWKLVHPLMMDILNPDRTPYEISTVLDQLGPSFFHFFWNAEPTKRMALLSDLCSKYLSVLVCMAVLGIGVGQLWKMARREPWQPLDALCVLGISLNAGLLFYISMTDWVPTVFGRHMYLSVWPLAFLTHRFLSNLPVFQRRAFIFSLILCAAMLWTNFAVQIVAAQLMSIRPTQQKLRTKADGPNRELESFNLFHTQASHPLRP